MTYNENYHYENGKVVSIYEDGTMPFEYDLQYLSFTNTPLVHNSCKLNMYKTIRELKYINLFQT